MSTPPRFPEFSEWFTPRLAAWIATEPAMSASEFARRTGLRPEQIVRIRAGQERPGVEKLDAMFRELGVTPTEAAEGFRAWGVEVSSAIPDATGAA